MPNSPKILSLDLGSRTGWAVFWGKNRKASGTWDLKEGATCRPEKYVNLVGHIRDCLEQYSVEVIAYEVVHFGTHKGTDAARLYNGLVANLESEAYNFDLAIHEIHISTAKKALTGSGRASKDDMIKSAKARWRSADIAYSDEADALGVGIAYLNKLCGPL